jgi:hypothetical protein
MFVGLFKEKKNGIPVIPETGPDLKTGGSYSKSAWEKSETVSPT